VGPLGLSDGTFDDYMVYFPIVISALPLGVRISVGTFSDCEDCTVSGEGIILLLGFLNSWRRWRLWVGFGFNLRVGVVWHWVGDLWNYCGICYFWSCRGYAIRGVGEGYG
jgi:hypothetical protein